MDRRFRLIYPALLWVFVGLMLMRISWTLYPHLEHPFILTYLGLKLGSLKAIFPLRKAAASASHRILAGGPVFTRATFILIAAMMSLGFIMRLNMIPPSVRFTVDLAVGSGLCLGAAWYALAFVRSRCQAV